MRGRPAPSRSNTHRAPTLASRVAARSPSFPARPTVSDGLAGTPVPSSAQHKVRPSFNDLRSGSAGAGEPAAAGSSAAFRRASRSAPTARVVRSIRFAPRFRPANSRTSSSARS